MRTLANRPVTTAVAALIISLACLIGDTLAS
jgi:hypothetical protein